MHYTFALALVAIVLAALAFAAQWLKRATGFARGGAQFVCVVESAMLSPRASVHVVRVGQRFILVGATDTSVNALIELEGASFDCAPSGRCAQPFDCGAEPVVSE